MEKGLLFSHNPSGGSSDGSHTRASGETPKNGKWSFTTSPLISTETGFPCRCLKSWYSLSAAGSTLVPLAMAKVGTLAGLSILLTRFSGSVFGIIRKTAPKFEAVRRAFLAENHSGEDDCPRVARSNNLAASGESSSFPGSQMHHSCLVLHHPPFLERSSLARVSVVGLFSPGDDSSRPLHPSPPVSCLCYQVQLPSHHLSENTNCKVCQSHHRIDTCGGIVEHTLDNGAAQPLQSASHKGILMQAFREVWIWKVELLGHP